MEYKLIKALNKRELRRILSKLGNVVTKVSSIYVAKQHFYLVIAIIRTQENRHFGLTDFTVAEQLIFVWAKSELDNSPDFIVHETNSRYVGNARESLPSLTENTHKHWMYTDQVTSKKSFGLKVPSNEYAPLFPKDSIILIDTTIAESADNTDCFLVLNNEAVWESAFHPGQKAFSFHE